MSERPHSQFQIDIPVRHGLLSFLIEGWQNRYDGADIAAAVKEEFLILFLFMANLGPSLFERGIGHGDRPSVQNSSPFPQY